jgi:hypothetical protein
MRYAHTGASDVGFEGALLARLVVNGGAAIGLGASF